MGPSPLWGKLTHQHKIQSLISPQILECLHICRRLHHTDYFAIPLGCVHTEQRSDFTECSALPAPLYFGHGLFQGLRASAPCF